MEINSRVITEDVQKVEFLLDRDGMNIPPMWQVVWPAFFIIGSITTFQLFLSMRMNFGNDDFRMTDAGEFSVFFSMFVSILISLAFMNGRARYLSLPSSVRKESLIVRHLVKKTKAYIFSWVLINIFIGFYVIKSGIYGPSVSSVGQFITLILMFFIFNIDMARYELAGLSTLIDKWKENKTAQ